MRISDWSSDVCSSDLADEGVLAGEVQVHGVSAGVGRRIAASGAVAEFLHHARAQRVVAAGWRSEFGERESALQRIILVDPVERHDQFGRVSCRERVCQLVQITVVAVQLIKILHFYCYSTFNT